MPRFDGTGPMGRGPMTGRGMGSCCVRGARRGFGRGFGWRAAGYEEPANLTKEERAKILEAELKEMEAEKTEIARRLKELKS